MEPIVRLHNVVAARCGRRLAARRDAKAVVSFTFDDFPGTAATVGAKILEQCGWRGTFYTSAGLMGKTTAVGKMFVRRDLDALVEAGHELACHTFDHCRCSDLSRADVLSNCSKNRSAIAEIVKGYKVTNFSFPEGVATLAAKKGLGAVYTSCRTIEPGINADPVDLGFLRANRLYSSSGINNVKELVQRAHATGGWLILYTHDVSERPSAWGCTREEFRDVVRYTDRIGIDVLPVSSVLEKFSTAAV